jgi:protein TonB
VKNYLVLLTVLFLFGCSTTPVEIDATSLNLDQKPASIVRISPLYPIDAARGKVEGWVQLKFDVAEDGSTQNIEVIDAMPKGVFEYEAERALSKWKYKPLLKDGKVAIIRNMKVQFDFRLN